MNTAALLPGTAGGGGRADPGQPHLMEASPPPAGPGEDFGRCAVRLAGFCTIVLGWPPDQFWRATPAEVAAVVAVLAPAGERPVDRAMLARLKEACPDG